VEKEKKIYDIRGEVIGWDEERNAVVVKMFDDIDWEKAEELLIDDRLYVYLDILNKLKITDAQRKYFWALMGSYEDYTGYPKRTSGDKLLVDFMLDNGLKKIPSTSRNGMSKALARELLQFVLEHMIEEGIPFYERQFYLAEDESKLFYALTMNRICWVCGEEHSHLHHYDAVQRGRNRNKIDHTKHRFMMLCANHHQEIHNSGNKAFCEKYVLKPIKLDGKSLKQLGIQENYEE
jgi:hypothetical protein